MYDLAGELYPQSDDYYYNTASLNDSKCHTTIRLLVVFALI
jgi:hypothetical protein